MRVVSKLFKSFAADETGATAIEYGLIVSLIFLACVGTMSQIGGLTVALHVLVAAMMSA